MAQTVMQELIEMLPDNAKKALLDNDNFYLNYFLEKEKQQIMNAWMFGKESKSYGYDIFSDAEKYYEEKYLKQ